MVNNGIVSKPINPQEIYYLLGVAPQGFYDIGYLCSNKHGRINPYSFHKPVRNNKLFFTSDLDFEGEYNGKLDNYGLRINGYATYAAGSDDDKIMDELIKPAYYIVGSSAGVKNGMEWTYMPPEGIIGVSPYRLLDFDGYNHNAPMPITRSQGEYRVDLSQTTKLELNFTLNPNCELPLGHMYPTFDKEIPGVATAGLSNYYVSVGVYKVSAVNADNNITEYARVRSVITSEKTLYGGATVTLEELNKLPVGEYWVGCMLDTKVVEGIDPDSSPTQPVYVYGRFYAPMPATAQFPNPFKLTIEKTIVWNFEIMYWDIFSSMSAMFQPASLSVPMSVWARSNENFGFRLYVRFTNYKTESVSFKNQDITAKITGGGGYWANGDVHTTNNFLENDPTEGLIGSNSTCTVTSTGVTVQPGGYCFLRMRFDAYTPSGLFADQTFRMTVTILREGAVLDTSPTLALSLTYKL